MNFFSRLKSGLSKSSGKLAGGIAGIFTKAKLDDTSLEALEELLIEADLGAKTAAELTGALAQQKFDKDITPQEVREFLAAEIAKVLQPVAVPLQLFPLPLREGAGGGGILEKNTSLRCPPSPTLPLKGGGGVCVILMVGVNGNGKTTTIGKLASQFNRQGLSVMLAAADTFRAAAVEQLQAWGERSAIPVITGAPNSDPASVAFRAYEQAKAAQADVLLIDTAGRLHNKAGLMAELQKIIKVLKKIDESAPHHVIQVLDATTGQNALSQVHAFAEMAKVTGLIIAKLDGTAKGGIVVALAKQCHIPIHFIGTGEGIDDLGPFEPIAFSRNLLGLP